MEQGLVSSAGGAGGLLLLLAGAGEGQGPGREVDALETTDGGGFSAIIHKLMTASGSADPSPVRPSAAACEARAVDQYSLTETREDPASSEDLAALESVVARLALLAQDGSIDLQSLAEATPEEWSELLSWLADGAGGLLPPLELPDETAQALALLAAAGDDEVVEEGIAIPAPAVEFADQQEPVPQASASAASRDEATVEASGRGATATSAADDSPPVSTPTPQPLAGEGIRDALLQELARLVGLSPVSSTRGEGAESLLALELMAGEPLAAEEQLTLAQRLAATLTERAAADRGTEGAFKSAPVPSPAEVASWVRQQDGQALVQHLAEALAATVSGEAGEVQPELIEGRLRELPATLVKSIAVELVQSAGESVSPLETLHRIAAQHLNQGLLGVSASRAAPTEGLQIAAASEPSAPPVPPQQEAAPVAPRVVGEAAVDVPSGESATRRAVQPPLSDAPSAVQAARPPEGAAPAQQGTEESTVSDAPPRAGEPVLPPSAGRDGTGEVALGQSRAGAKGSGAPVAAREAASAEPAASTKPAPVVPLPSVGAENAEKMAAPSISVEEKGGEAAGLRPQAARLSAVGGAEVEDGPAGERAPSSVSEEELGLRRESLADRAIGADEGELAPEVRPVVEARRPSAEPAPASRGLDPGALSSAEDGVPVKAPEVETTMPRSEPEAATRYVDTERNLERVGDALRLAVRRGVQRATLQLSPPQLGKVRMQVSLRQGAVSVHLDADSGAARDLLMSGLSTLRETFAEQGMKVQDFTVSYNANDATYSDSQSGGWAQHPPRRRSGGMAATVDGEDEASAPATGTDPESAWIGQINTVA